MLITPPARFRALVVDDDSIVRRMVMFALTQEGFVCDSATNGEHALARMGERKYDLLVTDLRMPNKNGHALSVGILENASRPVIMVHTSVQEPRLTRDLIFRGVDDVVYKPANYELFSAKARGFVERRLERAAQDARTAPEIVPETAVPIAAERSVASTASSSGLSGVRRCTSGISYSLSSSEVHRRLSKLDGLFPLSHAAFDVYSLSQQDADTRRLAALIERDASLTAEVLRLANCSPNSPGGSPVADVVEAIVRLGQRNIGQLALAVGGRQALAGASIPWIDRDILWKRSQAAGIGLRLIEKNQTGTIDSSDFLCALLHPVGRIIMATLFPAQHRELTERCCETGESLDEAEEAVFGLSYGQIGARLLASWRIPGEARLPLEHVARRFDGLSMLPKHVRHHVEKVKLAMLLGQIAVGRWDPTDTLDLPRLVTLKRINMSPVSEMVDTIRTRVIAPPVNRPPQPLTPESDPTLPILPRLAYVSPVKAASDWVQPMLASLGVRFHSPSGEHAQKAIVNGLTLGGESLREFIRSAHTPRVLGMVRTEEDTTLFASGAAIRLPTTVQALRDFLRAD